MKAKDHISKRINLAKLTWLERRVLEHTDPVNIILHMISIIFVVYGLWIKRIDYVLIGLIFMLVGHIYVTNQNKRKAKKK